MPELRSGRAAESRRAWLMNTPLILVLGLLVAYPIGYSFWVSLQRYNVRRPRATRFIGLDNYVTLWQDPAFLHSLRITGLFVVVCVVGTVAMALALAMVLNEAFPGRGLLRSLALLPWAMPGVVNGLMWRTIFDAKTGALNGILKQLGLIDTYQAWLSSPTSAFLFTAMAQVWNMMPFATILLLAGLSTIPRELHDAASVDGAGPVRRFFEVTLPWLTHPLLIVLILETMNSFRAFDTIYVLTGGGPGDATEVIAVLNVRTALHYTDFGLGSAYSWVITVFTLVVSLVYIGVLYRRGDFEA